jgi:hypothetical protein
MSSFGPSFAHDVLLLLAEAAHVADRNQLNLPPAYSVVGQISASQRKLATLAPISPPHVRLLGNVQAIGSFWVGPSEPAFAGSSCGVPWHDGSARLAGQFRLHARSLQTCGKLRDDCSGHPTRISDLGWHRPRLASDDQRPVQVTDLDGAQSRSCPERTGYTGSAAQRRSWRGSRGADFCRSPRGPFGFRRGVRRADRCVFSHRQPFGHCSAIPSAPGDDGNRGGWLSQSDARGSQALGVARQEKWYRPAKETFWHESILRSVRIKWTTGISS